MLALQKLQKLLFSTGCTKVTSTLVSVACGLPDLPQQHLFLPPTSPVAHSLSPQTLKTLPHRHGQGAGLAVSRRELLVTHSLPGCKARGHSVRPGEREPSQERLTPPWTWQGGRDVLPEGTMMLKTCSLAKALHPSRPPQCRAHTWLSEEQLGQVLVSAPAGPGQLKGPGRFLESNRT